MTRDNVVEILHDLLMRNPHSVGIVGLTYTLFDLLAKPGVVIGFSLFAVGVDLVGCCRFLNHRAPLAEIVCLPLALWAVDRGAAAHDDLLQGRAAVFAFFACAAIDLVLELEEAADAVGVDVVGDGRAA